MFFFFSSRRRHTRYWRDWSSDVCSSDLSNRPITIINKLLLRTTVIRLPLSLSPLCRAAGYSLPPKYPALLAVAQASEMPPLRESPPNLGARGPREYLVLVYGCRIPIRDNSQPLFVRGAVGHSQYERSAHGIDYLGLTGLGFTGL